MSLTPITTCPPLSTPPLPSDGIVVGLTIDLVFSEIAELMRLRLVEVLKVPLAAVHSSMELKDGKVIPEITVDLDQAEGLAPEEVKEVIATLWWGVAGLRVGLKDELVARLLDLRTRRGEKKKEAS